MESFRIEVGNNQQVKPGNIVGAIANEAGIDSSAIGRIEIFDDHSTVDLPIGMPNELFHALKKVWVMGKQLAISRVNERPSGPPTRPPRAAGDKPKPKSKRKKEKEAAESS